MKTLYSIVMFVLMTNIVCAQLDTARPTSRTQDEIPNGGRSIPPASIAEDINIIHESLIQYISSQWQLCGGDNSQMTSLFMVATHLLNAQEANNKAESATGDISCQEKSIRYKCMVEKDALSEIKKFVKKDKVEDFVSKEYRIPKEEARKLIKQLIKISNEQH